ncbi:MAG: protein translocase subunit SecF [Actinomycetia bacterium]|nr:protein translocase subunit SecF [Actinomycetes bacterium]
MNAWQKISRGETQIDFVGLRRRWFYMSAALLVISALTAGIFGLNLGLEFTGGVQVQTDNRSGVSVGELEATLTELGVVDSRIQEIDEGRGIRIQTGPIPVDVEDKMVASVATAVGAPPEDVNRQAVGPTFGALVARRALLALGVFLGAVVLFISIRLQWKMALSGIVALLHDLLITIGIYAITRFEVTPATVVAALTVLGYSLYDTVVVFDRVRELEGDYGDVLTYTEIVNRSMNMVLARSINTSLTSLIPVGSILFVGSLILGAAPLRDFSLALFVGIAAGTYSSIFVASPLLALWREREVAWMDQSRRVARRRGGSEPEEAVEVEQTPKPAPTSSDLFSMEGSMPPRPPKRRGSRRRPR